MPPKKASKRNFVTATPPAKKKVKKVEKVEDSDVEDAIDAVDKCTDPPTLTVVSWNVNGLRAWIKKGSMSYLTDQQPDIMCIQETKLGEEAIEDAVKNVEGYHSYWQDSEGKLGYAGVALYTKVKPIKVTFGMGIAAHDNEGRLITAEYDNFYLIGAYVPNSGHGLKRLDYRADWDRDFLAYICKLDKEKPVIYTGDLNVAHGVKDLKNPQSNKNKTPGFCDSEREAFTELLSKGFVDTFRAFNPYEKDCYTFWSTRAGAREKNIGWRLDYFVVSARLMGQVCDSTIDFHVPGSDHCPIILKMAI